MRLRILLTALLLLCASAAHAQFDTGQIAGIVRDSSNAGVPGATVTVENEANRDRRMAVTNSSGFYAVPDFRSAATASRSSCRLQAIREDWPQDELRRAARHRRPARGGRLEETVEVKASTSAVQTATAQVARTVDARQIQELTLNGRNPIFLALLKPGVRGGLMSTFNPDSVTNGTFSINGARKDEYLVTVDGAIATRTRSSGSMLGAQDVETVEEVQILTANYRAEYGRSSAGRSVSSRRAARGISTATIGHIRRGSSGENLDLFDRLTSCAPSIEPDHRVRVAIAQSTVTRYSSSRARHAEGAVGDAVGIERAHQAAPTPGLSCARKIGLRPFTSAPELAGVSSAPPAPWRSAPRPWRP